MTGKDEISMYEATRILITELNTSGYDFSEAVHKYVIGHIIPHSKTQVSFKSLLDEFEETLHLDKGESEIAYRENCIKKMLDKISMKLIQKEIDIRELEITEFTFKDMNDFLKVKLDIFNQEKPQYHDDRSKTIKQKLKIIAKGDSDDEKKENEETHKKWVPHKVTEKEQNIFKDTMEYIMDKKDVISVDEFIELMQEYLNKQKHSTEVLYKIKQFLKRRHCSLLESFQTYKSYEKFKNTEIHPEEYLKVLLSIGLEISENSMYKCLACFEYSSVDKIDYTIFVDAVVNAMNPRAKGLKNLRKFKSEDAIYEYIAEQCEIYFPLGSLCKDHDYEKNNTIEVYQLEKILRKGASEMTEGDLSFLLRTLNDGSDRIDIQEFIDNVNYYIKDRDKYQRLETRIPDKIFNPLDLADK